MENVPVGNFEVTFYEGVRVSILPSNEYGNYRIKVPKELAEQYEVMDSVLEQDGSRKYSLKNEIPAQFSLLIKHALECERLCRDIEAKIKSSKSQKYPLILKSNQSPTPTTPGKYLSRPNSPPTSIHPSQATSFHGARSIPSSSFYGNQGAPSVDTSKRPLMSISQRSSVKRPPLGPHQPRQSTNVASEGASVSASVVSKSSSATPIHFLENVGWCVQTNDKKFSMLFHDGVKVVVDPKSKTLEYHESDGKTVDW